MGGRWQGSLAGLILAIMCSEASKPTSDWFYEDTPPADGVLPCRLHLLKNTAFVYSSHDSNILLPVRKSGLSNLCCSQGDLGHQGCRCRGLEISLVGQPFSSPIYLWHLSAAAPTVCQHAYSLFCCATHACCRSHHLDDTL